MGGLATKDSNDIKKGANEHHDKILGRSEYAWFSIRE